MQAVNKQRVYWYQYNIIILNVIGRYAYILACRYKHDPKLKGKLVEN